MRRTVALILALAASVAPAAGREGADVLDAVRDDLAALRFERALATLERFLDDPALTEEQRVEALVLRADAHVAQGALGRAETDYREILALRPAWAPDASLTAPKAMARFEKVRAATVGVVELSLSPSRARVLVDGVEVRPDPDGTLWVRAGDRTFRAERSGFDPSEVRVRVEAGGRTPVRLRLVPNSRTVVIVTEPAGITVTVDGVRVGETAAVTGSLTGRGELVIENVPLGAHTFELEKPCYRKRRLADLLTVDLAEPAPKYYGPLVFEPVRGWIEMSGGPDGAEVRIDGRTAGELPLGRLELCPGSRSVEVRAAGRAIWESTETIVHDETRALEIEPRPNAVVLGATTWPEGLAPLAERVSTRAFEPLPAGLDLSLPGSWRRVRLDEDVDLALAVLPPEADGSPQRRILYAPAVGRAHPLDAEAVDLARPVWTETVHGMHLVDSRVGGTARVVSVREGGPAAAVGLVAGDRVVAVDGRPVESSAGARAALRSSGGREVSVRVAGVAGEARTLAMTGRESPRLLPPAERRGPRGLLLVAWAAVDGAVSAEPRGSAALASLAVMLSDAGRHGEALEAWRRVRWGERAGLGAGTVAYYVGRELRHLGRDREAARAFGQAARTTHTTFDDDGPEVAPAATDHLADLGVSGEGGGGGRPR